MKPSSAIGKRPAPERLPAQSGRREDALVGSSQGHFRVDGRLQGVETAYYDRSLLPLDEPLDGPAVVFHFDTTTVVPAGWSGRADASGNLILTKGGAA